MLMLPAACIMLDVLPLYPYRICPPFFLTLLLTPYKNRSVSSYSCFLQACIFMC